MGDVVARKDADPVIVDDCRGVVVCAGPAVTDPELAQRRLRIEIQGAVQGVGFRPFVYRLAHELALSGWVLNDTRGVFVEVEGPQRRLDQFLQRLQTERPRLAHLFSLDSVWLEPVGDSAFQIHRSDAAGSRTTIVLPDIATCPDCLADIEDPANRRYRYPFTNCTNCGPRFTIVQALPYDRPNTTMRAFTLCPACQTEYADPLDRRFHAQPTACPHCGPRLEWWVIPNQAREPAAWRHHSRTVVATEDDALRQAAEALRMGHIVAVKGLGGFHLMVDARDAAAVARLRERKARYEKPFALMARDLAQARDLCEISIAAEALLASPEAPIVLLPRRNSAPVARNVAPDSPFLGVMLPATPLHHLLLAELGFPVVATSGNMSDEPICASEEAAVERLGHITRRFLVHNRPIARHVDDSVAAIMLDQPRLLRRARGYAPLPVRAFKELPNMLAVGGHLKNTIALSLGRQVFISQHIGDLETPQAMEAFEQVIADFLRLYEAGPVAIAHDLHPDYVSTRWAREQVEPGKAYGRTSLLSSAELVAVQHHHAHLAACLAENRVEGPALGVTWDGTGYGADGTIWGGEFLLGDAHTYQRVAHLRPFRLPGGAAAVHEPARTALALLTDLYGAAALALDDIPAVRAFRPAQRQILGDMVDRGLNAPITTSAGRLFDAVAALIGLRTHTTFEGQAAMALEALADPGINEGYCIDIVHGAHSVQDPSGISRGEPLCLDWRPLVEAILVDVRRRVSPGIIAARFHNTLVDAIVAVARVVEAPRVALTGGCFQNRLLVERTARRLEATGFEVLLHRAVPPGDGGISLGQIAVAAAELQG